MPLVVPELLPVNVCTVFCEKVCTPLLVAMPVIAALALMLLIVLFETFAEPLKLTVKAVTAPVSPVMLLNVFPVTVLVGPNVPPSVLRHPSIIVAPVTVTFEKLLLLLL